MSKGVQCSCGRGYVSSWDGRCGHCRTNRQQKDHNWRMGKITRIYDRIVSLGGDPDKYDFHLMYRSYATHVHKERLPL